MDIDSRVTGIGNSINTLFVLVLFYIVPIVNHPGQAINALGNVKWVSNYWSSAGVAIALGMIFSIKEGTVKQVKRF